MEHFDSRRTGSLVPAVMKLTDVWWQRGQPWSSQALWSCGGQRLLAGLAEPVFDSETDGGRALARWRPAHYNYV